MEQDSDFRRLGRWVLIVGTVALVIVGLLALLIIFGRGHGMADLIAPVAA